MSVRTREPELLIGPFEPTNMREDIGTLLVHRRTPLDTVLLVAGAAVVAGGVFLRFWEPSALWLDEALSVNIASLPLTQIPHALSHDGAPPLFYILLHFWMIVFGSSDFSARALAGVISVASLPFFWHAGRRLGGRTTAWVTFFLAVASPFAINYATTVRMYSLMMLLSVMGYLVVSRALESPTRNRLIAVGGVTAAILYTHYWGLFLVATSLIWLGLRILRERWTSHPSGVEERLAVRRVFGAVILGSLVFLPWAPVFVFQTLHTGTPWTIPATASDLIYVFGDFAEGGPWGALVSFLSFALIALALFGRPAERIIEEDGSTSSAITLVLKPRRKAQPLFWITLGTLLMAVMAGILAHAAFVPRYIAVVFPFFTLLVALGISVLRERRVIAVLLSVLCLGGLLTGYGGNKLPRTQASQIAAVLNVEAQPGDLVVYCPDQLAPATDRLLTVSGLNQLTFPRATGPLLVNWVNYKQVIQRTNVGAFAQEILSRLGAGHTLWMVWRDGYPGLGGDCGALNSWFSLLTGQGDTLISPNGAYYERAALTRYPT